MSLFKKENKISYILIVSLKSSSIDVQLVKNQTDKKREVVFSLRTVMLLENSQDASVYTEQYKQSLQKIFSENSLTIKKFINADQLHVHFVLYTPWFTSAINSIIENQAVNLTDEFLNNKIDEIVIPSHLKTIERRIIKTQINGYTIPDISKIKKASNIKIDLYTSHISKKILESFQKVVENHFPTKKAITLSTSPMLFLDRIKEYMVREDNITIMYVGGEITELHIIRDDSLVYFGTFPIGKHDFLRVLQSTIKTYDYDIFDQKHIKMKSKAQEKQFDDLKANWSSSMTDLMKNFKQYVPSKLLVISDSKSQPFFAKLVNDSIIQNEDSPLKNHRIINFDISTFKDIISYNTSSAQEIDLILEALM